MKGRAPPPPPAPQPAPRRVFRNAVPDGGGPPGRDGKENALRPTVDLHVTLPAGYQTTINADGRKALMDLLVDLCSQYRLNPAYHTLELLSPEAQPVAFKPNALLGTLDVSCVLIKERVVEERVLRKPPPKVPEKTVRLVVNYHQGQKAVVRVRLSEPLRSLLPVICQKCELDPAHVLLLRDRLAAHELDLCQSLAELEIRELYAFDQTLVETLHSPTGRVSGTEKKGLLGLFKFNRRKSKTEELGSEDMDELDDSVTHSTDTCVNGLSMVGGPCVEVRPNTLGQSQSAMNLSRLSPKMDRKKRHAPPPPHTPVSCPDSQPKPGSPRPASQLKKRKAPAPPAMPSPEPPLTTPAPTVHVPAPRTGCGPAQAPPTSCAPAQDPPASHVPVHEGGSPASGDDTSSELSHSIEDSDLAGSLGRSSSSDDAANDSAASSLYDEPMAELPAQRSASSAPEPERSLPKTESAQNPQPAPRNAAKREPRASPTPKEKEPALELKMEDMEDSRHSAIGSGRYVPPKPRRVPLREPGRVARGPTPSSPPPPPGQGQHEAPLDISVETARHSWVHSAEQGVEQEAETASVCSSESFADQGYAASEGLAEDSVPLGSPCELAQPTSPEDTSLGRDPTSTPSRPKDCSSDSDEGCATWGSRHSGDVRREPRPGGTPKGFVDDAEVTAQINLTLADLDAELAVNHSGEAPVCVDDDILMSFVDMDIPVTTIDEVPGDDRPSVRDEHQRKEDVSNSLKNASVQDKNNNACMSEKASSGHTQADWIQPFSQEVVTRPGIKAQVHHKKVVSHDVSERSQRPVVKTPENVLERRLEPPPFVQSHSMVTSEIDRASSKAPSFAQIKITQNPVSRFGLKTFTVIPPKPTISQTPKPVHSMDQGAIKIDEFGNMVKQRAAPIDKYQNLGEATNNPDSPLVGKAKAFWSSAKKQGPASDTHKGDSVNASEVGVSKTIPVAVVSQPSEKSNEKEPLKKVSGPTSNPASTAENKLPMSDPAETATLTRQMKDLSFLKPSRRTSSHYVASAIAKYTGNPSTQVDGIPGLSESTSSKQSSSQGFRQTTNIHTISNHKDTQASANPVPYFAGPKRSLSYSGHVLEKQTTFEHPQTNITGKEMFFGTDGTESLNANPLDNKPRVHTQTSTCSEPTKPSSKEGVSTKITPEKASPVQSLTKTTRPAIPKKPELHTPGVLARTTQTSMFGPVMKFKPMIQKSMEKESSLHSSLMEAIQSGEGIERLHKVSRSPRASPLKKPCYVEAENERSALLSAIRAQSNSARLKKTRSEAAVELERFRNGEDNRAVQNDTTPPTPPEPPAFAPPPPPAFTPPPPPPLSAPPAPHSVPPSLPIATPKPALVLPPGGNPELAREVLLEAIRSGSGAERLKKVPMTSNTVKVNGRLGTIQVSPQVSKEH
uniref:WH2 domain-containing protein n=1 Tax=Electrophorus electricus TaxID=8005 RepID=A0AAY5EZA0_ELEEL